MSNLVIFEDQTSAGNLVLPEDGLSDLAKSLARNVGGGTTRRIATSTNGTFKRVVNGQQIGKAIRGEFSAIIVSLLPKVSREFYAKAYDPDAKATLPDCWSNLGDKPEENVPNKQGGNCANCPQNVKGSGKGGDRKACRFQRRVAILLAGDNSGEVYQFKIAATSLFGEGSQNTHPFESYVSFLLANGFSIDRVITKISYDLDADTMKLKFSPVRPITTDELELVKAAQEDPATSRVVQLTTAAADKVKALPASEEPTIFEEAKAAPASEPAATTNVWDDDSGVEDAEYEEVQEAPKKRPAKKKETVTDKGDLSDILDAWVDDED